MCASVSAEAVEDARKLGQAVDAEALPVAGVVPVAVYEDGADADGESALDVG